MMSVILELSIFPTDKGESVSPYVTRALEIIQDSGLDYELNAMGTCIEGDWPQVLDVVNRCFEAIQTDSNRIYLTMKADYRKGRSQGLKQKVSSVQSKLK
ncbi:MAG TPA: MTH1187 family thiamine-binding protein [Desulfobacterales bacterium]